MQGSSFEPTRTLTIPFLIAKRIKKWKVAGESQTGLLSNGEWRP
jgi:hypothetical protein